MVENRNQFYLYDRWYYLINETENKLTYSSNIDSKTDANRLEIDKENNKINIIYLSDKKTTGKLEISIIDDNQTKFHYTQFECSEICVNDEIYENLLFEIFCIKNKKTRTENTEILFTRKRKLNKMCYREPDFPLNRKINIKDIKPAIKELKMFDTLVNSYLVFLPKILKLVEQPQVTEIMNETEKEKTVEIPENIQVYDRNYSFIRQENDKILYENNNCGITNLEIRINPNDMMLLGIKIVSKEKSNEEAPKHIIEINSNKENGIIARYHNCKKTDVYINNEKFEQARIKSEVTFDSKDENIGSNIEINSKNRVYKLVPNPISANVYQDEKADLYKIYCNYFVDFQSMVPYIPGIYNHVKNSIFKEKELIKK